MRGCCHGASLPPSDGRSEEVSFGRFLGGDGDRELPGRSVESAGRSEARAPVRLRSKADAVRAKEFACFSHLRCPAPWQKSCDCGLSLAESEQRFRDLYEEAPLSYVKEDLESKFISANRAAMQSRHHAGRGSRNGWGFPCFDTPECSGG